MLNRVRVHLHVHSAFLLFLPLPPPSPGGLLSTTSGAHGGGWSVESRDGGEELSSPAVKRKCIHDEHGMSLASGFKRESVYCRSHITTGHVIHQFNIDPQPTRPSPSQPLPPPHPDSPLGKYAKRLRGCFTRHQPPNTKWPPLPLVAGLCMCMCVCEGCMSVSVCMCVHCVCICTICTYVHVCECVSLNTFELTV